jgi:hypothetical protein
MGRFLSLILYIDIDCLVSKQKEDVPLVLFLLLTCSYALLNVTKTIGLRFVS